MPSQQLHAYHMMQHTGQASRALSYFPYSILQDGEYTASVGGIRPGVSNLPEKEDRYRTSEGVLSLEEYNKRCQAARPANFEEPYRHLCGDWVKYNYDTPLADDLFKIEQRRSRLLKDKGAGLSRADIEAIRQQND